MADINDFRLGRSEEVDAQEILNNSNITLYILDFPSGRAVFVETPPEVDLSHAPFFYQSQWQNALRVLTVPFETMIQLAQCIPLDDKKLILIHSTGRAGSTLASQIFAQVESVINISEPDVLTQLVAARFMQPGQHDMLKNLLEASIRLLCKTPVQTAWAIKGRSFVIELADWLYESHPQTKNLYLYRDAVSWIKSMLGTFVNGADQTSEQLLQAENETRGWMQYVVPLVGQYDPGQHLTTTELLILMWLSNMERYMELYRSGIRMLAIPYSCWQMDPRQTAMSMLEYCACRTSNMEVIEETLKKDSQAGTSISKEAVKNKSSGLQHFDAHEMNRHLQRHAYINSPDFEAANTLKI